MVRFVGKAEGSYYGHIFVKNWTFDLTIEFKYFIDNTD